MALLADRDPYPGLDRKVPRPRIETAVIRDNHVV
jgi:hypothetical protein